MSYKEELTDAINEFQASIDLLIQKLNQARQKLSETRINVDNDQLRPGELSLILDELIISLSSGTEQGVPGIIGDLYGLQRKIAGE